MTVLTKRYEVRGVMLDKFTYDKSFRDIRAGAGNKMDRCFQCEHQFEDNEKISLVFMVNHSNEVLCKTCAVALQ